MTLNNNLILTGRRILIVEDDYLLACDAECCFSSAGAEIIGPFATEADALEAIHRGGIDGAVTDVNLGMGASFEVAHVLRQVNVPFVFLTGYDPASIPEELRRIPCFRKPVDMGRLVKEFARVLALG